MYIIEFDSFRRGRIGCQDTVTGRVSLDRYDGYSILSWKPDPDNPNTLSHGFTHDLLAVGDGGPWIGTARGLDRLDTRPGTITRAPVQLPNGSRSSAIHADSLVESESGDVYPTGLRPVRSLRGRRTLEVVDVVGHLSHPPNGFDNDAVGAVAIESTGAVWFVATGALGRIEPDRDRWWRFCTQTWRVRPILIMNPRH